MIALTLLAVILVGMFGGGVWGAVGLAALLFGLYRVVTRAHGPRHPLRRDTLNAFQKPLADD